MLQDDNNFLKISVINGMIDKVFLIRIPRDHEYGYSNRLIVYCIYDINNIDTSLCRKYQQ